MCTYVCYIYIYIYTHTCTHTDNVITTNNTSILHARNRKSELPFENATDNPFEDTTEM